MIRNIRKIENRIRLAEATAHYFEQLDPKTVAAENALAADMMSAARKIDFDGEI